jgi:hypothetical protein
MPARRRHHHTPQTTNDHLATLERAIRQLSYSQHLFTVFRHFVELSALALSNVADPINKAAREAQYLAIVRQYTLEQFQQFPPLLGMLATCLEQAYTDVLGRRPVSPARTPQPSIRPVFHAVSGVPRDGQDARA